MSYGLMVMEFTPGSFVKGLNALTDDQSRVAIGKMD